MAGSRREVQNAWYRLQIGLEIGECCFAGYKEDEWRPLLFARSVLRSLSVSCTKELSTSYRCCCICWGYQDSMRHFHSLRSIAASAAVGASLALSASAQSYTYTKPLVDSVSVSVLACFSPDKFRPFLCAKKLHHGMNKFPVQANSYFRSPSRQPSPKMPSSPVLKF